MSIQRFLLFLLDHFDPMFYVLIGIGIGYLTALAVYEYCNYGRMSENDLLRWENHKLRMMLTPKQGIPAARQDGGDGSKPDRRGQSK